MIVGREEVLNISPKALHLTFGERKAKKKVREVAKKAEARGSAASCV